MSLRRLQRQKPRWKSMEGELIRCTSLKRDMDSTRLFLAPVSEGALPPHPASSIISIIYLTGTATPLVRRACPQGPQPLDCQRSPLSSNSPAQRLAQRIRAVVSAPHRRRPQHRLAPGTAISPGRKDMTSQKERRCACTPWRFRAETSKRQEKKRT